MQALPDVLRGTHVLRAAEQQSGNIDARQHVAEIRFGCSTTSGEANRPSRHRREDQRAGNRGMPTVQFEREATTPLEAGHVWSPQAERRDERGQAVGPVGQAEAALRWVR